MQRRASVRVGRSMGAGRRGGTAFVPEPYPIASNSGEVCGVMQVEAPQVLCPFAVGFR